MFALVKNGTVIEWPIENLSTRYPNSSIPSEILSDAILPEGCVKVTYSTPPQYNPSTHRLVAKSLPEFSDGKWVIRYNTVPLNSEELAAVAFNLKEQKKKTREHAVSNIEVTTAAGNTFDGDETSQTRMARAILVLSTGAASSVPWVLADNTVIEADIAELTEALAKAGAAQAALWVIE